MPIIVRFMLKLGLKEVDVASQLNCGVVQDSRAFIGCICALTHFQISRSFA